MRVALLFKIVHSGNEIPICIFRFDHMEMGMRATLCIVIEIITRVNPRLLIETGLTEQFGSLKLLCYHEFSNLMLALCKIFSQVIMRTRP